MKWWHSPKKKKKKNYNLELFSTARCPLDSTLLQSNINRLNYNYARVLALCNSFFCWFFQRWTRVTTGVYGVYDQSWNRERPVELGGWTSFPGSHIGRQTIYHVHRTLCCKILHPSFPFSQVKETGHFEI